MNLQIIELLRKCDSIVKKLREEGVAAVSIQKFSELLGADLMSLPADIVHMNCFFEIRDGYVILWWPPSKLVEKVYEKGVLKVLK